MKVIKGERNEERGGARGGGVGGGTSWIEEELEFLREEKDSTEAKKNTWGRKRNWGPAASFAKNLCD